MPLYTKRACITYCLSGALIVRKFSPFSLPIPWGYTPSDRLRLKIYIPSPPLGRRVVAAVEAEINISESKVRFDSKARAASSIGIIDKVPAEELISIQHVI